MVAVRHVRSITRCAVCRKHPEAVYVSPGPEGFHTKPKNWARFLCHGAVEERQLTGDEIEITVFGSRPDVG